MLVLIIDKELEIVDLYGFLPILSIFLTTLVHLQFYTPI